MRRFLPALLFIAATFLPAPSVAEQGPIAWRAWNTETFKEAAAEDKLIFIDVGTEWCSACNAMNEGSYKDPRVHKLLREHYVAIHVDAEAETDIGERYGFWGWPALVFMTPNGDHVHFVRGYMLADDFVWLLDLLLERRKKGELQARPINVDLKAAPVDGPLDGIVDTARNLVDRFYDAENGGWGRARMPAHELVQQALWRSRTTGDDGWRDRAIETATKTRKMLDPVWGGVFFGAAGPNWDRVIYERRTEHQASAITIFAEAYKRTGDKVHLDAAIAVARFLDGHFRRDDGLYITSQEQHLAGRSDEITPAAYFALGDAERRKLGLPPTDTTAYTDINAKLLTAFADLYAASGEARYRDRALAIGLRMRTAVTPGGWLPQILTPSQSPDRIRDLPADANDHVYLRAQAFAGKAFLTLHRITGDQKWLEAARGLADAMHQALWYQPKETTSAEGAGYLGSSRRVVMPNGTVIADRPLVDNAAAADFLLRLSSYGKGHFDDAAAKTYRDRAETALRSSSNPQFVRENDVFIGQYVLAVHALRDEFIDVTVVCGETSDPACRDLWKKALHEVRHVRKIVKLQGPGRYPDMGEPAVFVCTSKLCSDPILASDKAPAASIEKFMARLDDFTRQ